MIKSKEKLKEKLILMKKVNSKALLKLIGIYFAVGLVISVISAFTGFGGNVFFLGKVLGSLFMYLLATFFLLAFLMYPISSLLKKKAKKTMETLANTDFNANGTFYASSSTIKIDVNAGKIAYVSNYNPSELQIIDADKISKVKSSYNKGPLGGTNYVYFEFYYDNKRRRFPTFTSNTMYMMNSNEVQTAISKADTYAELLRKAAGIEG